MTRRRDPMDLLELSGIDLSQPFVTSTARRHGLDSRSVLRLVDAGLLRRPLRGVYCSAHLPDTLALRVAVLGLVVPQDAVVTDRSAAWLHGAEMALAPGDHLRVPEVSIHQAPGNRLRNVLTVSGERSLLGRDIEELGGLRVTTPLRTALDLGRLLRRDAALAALDALSRLERFDREELLMEVERFRGFRGVRQLRVLAPLADPGAESFGESALRLRWYDACSGLVPETQIEVVGDGRMARLDLGSREVRYAAEYDGEAFHGADVAGRDAMRRSWLADQGWLVEVFRRDDVFGHAERATDAIARGVRRARLTMRWR